MITLSLHTGYHDATAALFFGYDLLAAVQLERLTRKKGDGGGGVSEPCIEEVLGIAGVHRRDIGALVLSRASYPWRYYRSRGLGPVRRLTRLWDSGAKMRDMSSELFKRQIGDARAIFDTDSLLSDLGLQPGIPVFFSNHHMAHALSAFFHTDWNEALLYTADGCGDNVHYSMRHAAGQGITCFYGDDRELLRPRSVNSLGLAYGFATEALGFRMNRHEGKLTGLAALGEPRQAKALGGHFRVDEDGFLHSDFETNKAMRAEIVRLAALEAPAHMAASIQQVLEDCILLSVRRLLKRSGSRHLALAGGVFANVRLNRLLCEETDIDEIFIYPAMGDEGLAVGGALEYFLSRDGYSHWSSQRRRLRDVYLGRDGTERINDMLTAGADMTRLDGDPVELGACLLANGAIGAIYEGRMEFGPRALGARSILASPADAAVNKELNDRLERTDFMPFAPYVLAEDADQVFAITERNRYACRFMTITTRVRPEWRERIPAVVHVDGTARPQIIDDETNPLYARILRRFKDLTGLPVLVNTSFNVHEEPIINKPEECLRALRDGRIDFVITRAGVYCLATASIAQAGG